VNSEQIIPANERIRYYFIVSITLFPVVVLLLIVFIGVFRPIFVSMQNIVNIGYTTIRPLHHLEVVIAKAAMPPHDFLLNRNETEIENWQDVKSIVEDSFNQALESRYSPFVKVELLSLRDKWQTVAGEGDRLFIAGRDPLAKEASTALMESFDAHINKITAQLSVFTNKQENVLWAEYVEIENLKIKAVMFSIAAVFVGLFFGVLGSIWLTQIRKQIIADSLYDPLTGIYNRRAIERAFARVIIERKSWENPRVSVLLMDLDRFKQINDRYGHDTGDIALASFARQVAGMIRNNDSLGRYGGEEFLLILPQTGHKEAVGLAERIRRQIEETTITIPGKDLKLQTTVSIGCATGTSFASNVDDIVKRADEAMYQAKEQGRNRVVSVTL